MMPDLPVVETLLLELTPAGVLHVTLNRPDARNAMNRAMAADLGAVFDVLGDRHDVRAVVLRGAGGHFCAGGDLREMMSDGVTSSVPGAVDTVAATSRSFGTLLRKAGAIPQPLIVVCEGTVLAGGMGLVCVSDIALARVDARFGVPETRRGLPPAQIAPFLVERIGLTAARRLCLTGAQFDGAQALSLGLVHECCSDAADLQLRLQAIVADVMACAPRANAVTKAILMNAGGSDVDSVLDQAAEHFARAVRGDEAAEGIAAFLQKRVPAWSRQTHD